MVSAIELARYIIAYTNENSPDVDMTNLRLQKTLYYVQGYYSKEYNECLFNDEFYNWTYGPVVPEIYYVFCVNTYKSIIIPEEQRSEYIYSFSTQVKCKSINRVIDECNKHKSSELVNMTHNESPWKNTIRNQMIDKEAIKKFFGNNDPLGIS